MREPVRLSPLGKAEDKRGKVVINERAATVVRQIFQLAGSGASVCGIAARLNEMGVVRQRRSRSARTQRAIE
jgi:hypothetical protein